MQSLMLLFITFLARVTSQQCPGMYPHPSDCDKFYQCDSSRSYLFNCPEGTLFDKTLGLCNHKYLVTCSSSISSIPPSPTTTTISVTYPWRPQTTVRPSTSVTRPSWISSTSTVSTNTDMDGAFNGLDISTPNNLISDPENNHHSGTNSEPASESGSDSGSNLPSSTNDNKPSGVSLPSEINSETSDSDLPNSEVSDSEPEYSVSASSLYPCSQPGYYSEETSCDQFYVCKEVAPGVLSADRIFRY